MYGFSLYKIIIYTVYRVIFAPLANSFFCPFMNLLKQSCVEREII